MVERRYDLVVVGTGVASAVASRCRDAGLERRGDRLTSLRRNVRVEGLQCQEGPGERGRGRPRRAELDTLPPRLVSRICWRATRERRTTT